MLVPITLTLPGIAGIILTIGVASDANVVIFERVREEARSGKSPRAAILSGYKKGISAIIDANVVTLATAAILFLFATAGVKGFAFTLFIGVLLSLFTAVVATRAAFNVLAETRFLRDDRYLGLRQREIKWKFDWVGHWKLWMAISFIPLALGAVYIGINGLNLGLDFESGTRAEMRFERPATEDGVRSVLQTLNIQGTKVQASTEKVNGRTVDGFQVTTETLQPPQVQALRTALDQKYGLVNHEFVSLDTVGPVFGKQIIRNAIYAILLSFAVIILYLSFRFEYKLALPALLSVIHDVWLSISIYSFTGREVTSATVAALLTILGYSLYDVVIVFDRIRENVPIMRRSTYREIVNTSIHETLTRSIITQIITLIPIGALYLFGGDTLKDFAFALLVGHPLRRDLVDRHRGADRRALEGARARAEATDDEGRAPRPPGERPDGRLRRRRPRGARARRGRPRQRDAARGGRLARRRGARGRGAPSDRVRRGARARGRGRARARAGDRARARGRARAGRGARGRGGRRFGGRRRGGGRAAGAGTIGRRRGRAFGAAACRAHAAGAPGLRQGAPPPAGPAEEETMTTVREGLEQAVLLSIGAASLTRERAEAAVAELVRKGQIGGERGHGGRRPPHGAGPRRGFPSPASGLMGASRGRRPGPAARVRRGHARRARGRPAAADGARAPHLPPREGAPCRPARSAETPDRGREPRPAPLDTWLAWRRGERRENLPPHRQIAHVAARHGFGSAFGRGEEDGRPRGRAAVAREHPARAGTRCGTACTTWCETIW